MIYLLPILLAFLLIPFLLNSKLGIQLDQRGIRQVGKKRNWEIHSIKKDNRYGYTETQGSNYIYSVLYKNVDGVEMKAVVKVGFFGLDVAVEYESPIQPK